MKFIQENWVGLVAMLIAILGCYLPVSNAIQQFGGAACNGGNCTDYDAVNVTDGYYVDDTQIINGSGSFVQESFSVNGIGYQYARSASLNAASTTVCTITTSATATSTLQSASLQLSISTTTAHRVFIGSGAFVGATTTSLGFADYAAGAQSTTIATTTPLNNSFVVFPPSTRINFTMSGGIGTFSPTGVCSAVLRATN